LVPTMIATLNNPEVDLVIGSRYVSGGSTDQHWPWYRQLSSRFAASLARFCLKIKIKDPLSGFMAIRKSKFLSATNLQPIGWKVGLEIIVKCECRHIKEIPIHFSERKLGTSKLNFKIAMEYFMHLFHLLAYRFSHQ